MFKEAIRRFVSHMDSLRVATPPLLSIAERTGKELAKSAHEFLKEHGTDITEDDTGGFKCTLPPRYLTEYLRRASLSRKFVDAMDVLPNAILISLVSQFDALVADIARALYHARPKLLDASNRALTFAQLKEFPTVEDARNYLVDKEIESLLHENHVKQFKWFSEKLDVPLTKDLPSWPTFIEVLHRRHLLVHVDGRVSDQYIRTCQEHGYQFAAEPTVGDRLSVNPAYFESAHATLFEIGVKFANVVWRKACPQDIEDADTQLNMCCVDIIADQRYDLAIKLLEFAVGEFSRRSSNSSKIIYQMNLAQCFKWSDDEDRCAAIINQIDWSALEPKFLLGKAVLQDDFDEAAKIMKSLGPSQDMIPSYQSWPIFRVFRTKDVFRNTYEAIYKEPFTIREDSPPHQSNAETTPGEGEDSRASELPQDTFDNQLPRRTCESSSGAALQGASD